MQTASERARFISTRYSAEVESSMRELHGELMAIYRKGMAWSQIDQDELDRLEKSLAWIDRTRAGVMEAPS